MSGLPEGLFAFAARVLCIKADVAQQMRVKLGKALAVAAAGQRPGESGQAQRDKAAGKAERQGLDPGPGHLRLLRFVLIQ